MEHLAILNKKICSVEQIIAKEKTIESRWLKKKGIPWNKINGGDVIYFKNSGEPVIAKAIVDKVFQFEDLNLQKTKRIIKDFGDKIKFVGSNNPNFPEWFTGKNYAILIFLKNPERIKPFNINKKGYGSLSAWITIEDISKIKLP